MKRYLSTLAIFACAALLAAACGDDAMTGDPDLSIPGGGGDGGGGNPDGSANTGDGSIPDMRPVFEGGIPIHDGGATCYLRTCQGKLYACGDCIDNDGDNLIDSEDPNCLGACSNNEAAFFGAIPGQNNAPCKMDCYFDQDTGSGNDHCEWDHSCDPHQQQMNPEIGCTYDKNTKFPGGATCADRIAMQDPVCKTVCGPLTPNGCDCFGCCVDPNGNSTTEGFFLGSLNAQGVPTCDVKSIKDPTKCRPCQIVTSCFKGCGKCQLCVGKPELPPECFGPIPDGGTKPDGGFTAPDGGVMGQCPGGETPCGLAGQAPCAAGFYCVTGCCQPIIG